MAGFILLSRKFDDEWGWGDDPLMTHTLVKVIFKANFKDSVCRGRSVERGSFVTTIRQFSSEIGLTVSQTRRCLNMLREYNIIDIQTTNHWTKISVCDYDSYQILPKDEQQIDYTSDNRQETRGSAAPKKGADTGREAVDRLYAMYPSSVVRIDGNKVPLRSSKDKEKIARLLKTKTEDELAATIQQYLAGNPGPYTRMLSTFLNNLPDYTDGQLFTEPSAPVRKGRKPQE